jgi:hypothetical protein
VEIFEISKHSITRGTCGSCSASANARTSAIGSIVLGKLLRVNRRIGLVVLRKSSIMLRSSAAFSKSIFFAAFRISSSNVAIISLDFPSKNSEAWRTRSRYCSALISLKRTGT